MATVQQKIDRLRARAEQQAADARARDERRREIEIRQAAAEICGLQYLSVAEAPSHVYGAAGAATVVDAAGCKGERRSEMRGAFDPRAYETAGRTYYYSHPISTPAGCV